ncbi:MAG: hypothetical protein ACOZEN_09925 [Thermodesulfobacteriota bacterium]
MKKAVAAFLLLASLQGVQTASAQSVQTQVISRYLAFDIPAVVNSQGILRSDATNVYLDLPGARLSASDGSYYDHFLSFTLTMPKSDWLAFMFN